MPDNSSDRYILLNRLVDEFGERFRRGERPSLQEYIDRYPDLADDIREMFPVLVEVEQVRGDKDEQRQTVEPQGSPPALEQLGDFRILREIGRGGMGIVYEAEQLSLGRRVALKVLPATLLEPNQVERFEREARAAAKLHHTNIVPVYGVGHDNGLHYYVMQFIHGQPLDAVLDEVRRLRLGSTTTQRPEASAIAQSLLSGQFAQPASGAASAPRASDTLPALTRPGSPRSGLSGSGASYWQSVARMGAQIAEALAYAHAQGTLHRDIKPANLLLDAHGIVWVTDFGLAKASDSSDLTGPGEVVGTLRFIPPERFGGTSDARGDVYSLGLTLYEMLTLRSAFHTEDRVRLIELILHREPPPPRTINPEVPRDLETVVLKAMARDPAHRYPSAADLAADLTRFAEDRPITARRIGAGEQFVRWCRRNPVVAGLLLTVAMTLLAGTAAAMFFAFEAKKQEFEAKKQAEAAQVSAAGEGAEKQRVQNLMYNARITVASKFLDDLKINGLHELLVEAVPRPGEKDPRGFEYWYLWHQVNDTARTLSLGEPWRLSVDESDAWAYWLSSDGRRAGRFKRPQPTRYTSIPLNLTVWDTADGRVIGSTDLVVFDDSSLYALAVSPDGRRVAWHTPEGTLVVWDIDRGKMHSAWPLKRTPQKIVFNPKGERLAVVEGAPFLSTKPDNPPTLRIWDLADRGEVLSLPMDGSWGVPPVFTPDGREVVVRSGEKKWTIRSAEGGAERLTFEDVSGLPIVSPDGRWLVVAGEKLLSVWNLPAGKRLRGQFSLPSRVGALAISPDGKILAVSRERHPEVPLYDFEEVLRFLELASPESPTMTFTPSRLLRGPGHAISQMAFTANGSRLAALDRTGLLREWDLTRSDQVPLNWGRGEELPLVREDEPPTPPGQLGLNSQLNSSITFSGDGQRMAGITYAPGCQVGVWDTKGHLLVRRSLILRHEVVNQGMYLYEDAALDLSRDGRRLACWSVPRADSQEVVTRAVQCLGMAGVGTGPFTAPGLWVKLVSSPTPVRVIDVDADRDLFTLSPEVAPVQFSPDGRLLAGGNIGWFDRLYPDSATTYGGTRNPPPPRDTDWHVWDATTGRPVLTRRPKSGSQVAVAFRPDGRQLAVWTARGPESGELTLWDLDTGRAPFSEPCLAGPASLPERLQFSPDGRRLAAVGCHWSPRDFSDRPRHLTLWEVTEKGAKIMMDHPRLWFYPSDPLVVFSPDDASLAAHVDSGAVIVWDARTGNQRSVLRSHGENIGFAGFSSDGKRVLTANHPVLLESHEQRGRVWDVETGHELLSLHLASDGMSPRLHFDGRRILVPNERSLHVIDGSPAQQEGP